MYGEYKKQLSAKTGTQRYKHSLVIDLDGIPMSLGTNSKHRHFLKRIFDVGTQCVLSRAPRGKECGWAREGGGRDGGRRRGWKGRSGSRV